MFIKFITSRLLQGIVCAAAGLYGLYNAISCVVTLYKAGHQPYLMAGTVRFDFQGYYNDGRHARRHLCASGRAAMALFQMDEKAAEQNHHRVNFWLFCNVFPPAALLG